MDRALDSYLLLAGRLARQLTQLPSSIPTSIPSPVPSPVPARPPGLPVPAGPASLVHQVGSWFLQRPWLALVAIALLLGWLVGFMVLTRWRHRRLSLHPEQ